MLLTIRASGYWSTNNDNNGDRYNRYFFFWLKLFFNDYNQLLKNVQISIWILDED